MASAIKIDKLSSAIISGEKPPLRQLPALRNLPAKLDAKACLEILSTLQSEWTVEAITAAGKQLDISDIDAGLEYKDLSLEDRMRFKSALAEFGFIARGRKPGPLTWGA
jgi:hypothetical protein